MMYVPNNDKKITKKTRMIEKILCDGHPVLSVK